MADKISHQPMLLDLELYAGDGIAFKLICTDSENAPLPITGTVKSQIRVDRISDIEPIIEFASNLAESADGIIYLSLTGQQTQQLPINAKSGKFNGVWDVQWTPEGSEPSTLCQGKVLCVADVTR